MGIKEKLFGSEKGISCETGEDGRVSCKVYKNRGNQKMATGTDVTVTASPENNCEPQFVGNFSINEEDEEQVTKLASQIKKQCQRGLG